MRVYLDGRLINKIQNTGISRYTEFIIDFYLSKGVDLTVITNDVDLRIDGCKMVFTNLKPYNIFHFCIFWLFVKRFEIDLFHSPFYSSFFKKSNFKTIVTVHDLMYKFVPDFFGENQIINQLKRFYFDLIVGVSLNNADELIAVSETTQDDVFKLYGRKAKVIPEHSEIACNDLHQVLKKYNLTYKKYFFYCGNSRPHKNVDFVKSVFAGERRFHPLVLAGNGHGECSNVQVLGVVSDSDLGALYKGAKAFIFPSKYEGFGLPILESLKLETPVIASNIPAFMEFESENIHFFAVDDYKSFVSCVEAAMTMDYIDEPYFFSKYDRDNIYLALEDLVF